MAAPAIMVWPGELRVVPGVAAEAARLITDESRRPVVWAIAGDESNAATMNATSDFTRPSAF
jgi:hypothetical protein